ncbi:hypothetical protein LRP49_09120 [Enterovibrio sp. ZSDZ35]|uniref:Uncharacterized protein n=1 Tax=Enterovibrio qingdaonensis TaxID=2899818 RepID=A0ABT5QK54_9GAMM|nr:hypothetical protein [Enterovibrio sp. ZSDZ35]MDD1781363.1 hypothetical protein [Enterovibrio sp. ZSDZ35]
MTLMWGDALLGCAWGFWLALYLDRLYLKQVTLIKLGVFVFWGRSYKANNTLAFVINLLALSLFLLGASAVIGGMVTAWMAFIVGWCASYACYVLFFSSSKQTVPGQQGE